MTKKLGLAMAATVVLLAGCGGGGGGRPSVDEISQVFQDGGDVGGQELNFPKEQADCVAKAYHDSDVSDEALNAIVDKDEDYKASDEDTKALTSVSAEDIATCMTGS